MADPMIEIVVEQWLKRKPNFALGTEFYQALPEERSQLVIRNQIRAVAAHLRRDTSIWNYFLVSLFGTGEEKNILAKHQHSHFHYDFVKGAHYREENEREIQEELEEDAKLHEQLMHQMENYLKQAALQHKKINQQIEAMLKAQWAAQFSNEEHAVLSEETLHPLEHEAHIEALEKKIETHVFSEDKLRLICVSDVDNSTPLYYSETHQNQARDRARQNYSKLVSALRESAVGIKMKPSYSPHVEASLEATADRYMRAYALVAALQGVKDIDMPFSTAHNTQHRSSLREVVQTVLALRLPEVAERLQTETQIQENFKSEKSRAVVGEVLSLMRYPHQNISAKHSLSR